MQRRARPAVAAALYALTLLVPGISVAEDDTFSEEQLDQMLAPIALHPDALLSQMLMASTYPLDVAEAAEWSKAHADEDGDEAVKAVEDKPWDPSVKSLVAFPPVLAMMGEKPDWVQSLGDAFLAEPDRVMDRIQFMRKKAKDQGSLESNEQQTVSMQDPEDPEEADEEATTVVVEQAPAQVIVIEPAAPQVVYVPTYDPMVVYGTWWWPRYRPWYWRPVGWGYGAGLATGIAFGIGIGVRHSLWGGFRWGRNDVNIDVNHYNNINVDNRIQSRDRNADWKHDPDRRRGTPYRDSASREKYGRDGQAGRVGDDARGRDASRQRAQDTLAKHGADPAAARDKLRNDPQTRERAQASAERGTARPAARDADRAPARAAAQNAERGSARRASPSRGGDSAFKGAGNAASTRQSIDRGSSSRRSAGSYGGSRGAGMGAGGMRGGSMGGGGMRRR